MAYPGEKEHVEYLKYVEEWASGNGAEPMMSKAEWRKRMKGEKRSDEKKPVGKQHKPTERRSTILGESS